ncbi:Transcriptional regulator, LysR family [hydrothermal vent metagenome]|uniref:Transcriptional regulator, LysR family n=1 Tax=hydrothermal vent metagenome TaxID=652676 RepID=A0A3B1A3Z9_9ZZZZ
MIANMHSLDWNDLRFFLAVAEQGSLSAASKILNVNHSTVFRRINQLEKSIGVRLFERLADGYQLTQAGEDMAQHVARMRNEVDALTLQVAGKDFQPAGIVRITAPSSLAYYYISYYLKFFCKKYPGISVELNVSNENLDISRRETDIAVRSTATPPQHLIGKKIFSLSWAFYASEEYLRGRGTPSSMLELSGHDLIGPDGRVSHLKAFEVLNKNLGPDYRIRGNDLMVIASLAIAGNGIALLPDDQVYTKMKRLFTMEPLVTSDIWILTHQELRATERVRLLMNFIVDSFRNEKKLRELAIQS